MVRSTRTKSAIGTPLPLLLPDIPSQAIEHGEVFTREWVVDLILDLVGYDAGRDLAKCLAIEPACGAGAFLGPMVLRMSRSCRRHGRTLDEAHHAIRAYDLLPQNVEASRRLVEKVLIEDSWPAESSTLAAEQWVRQGDYLLQPQHDQVADFVVGNPPYIRLEDVPNDRMAVYRTVCSVMTGRSDIYVGFFEVGLRSLKPGGSLGFICADRWMRNQYGQQLRQMIASGYSVDVTVTMHDVDAFEAQVAAYPAISIIRRNQQGQAAVVDANRSFGPEHARSLVHWSTGARPATVNDAYSAACLPHWFEGSDSWPSGSPAMLKLIEHLNDRFPPLEDPTTATRVGIGVATGADAVFVATEADVEPARLLPLSMVRDTKSGRFSWSGHHLVNPWGPNGKLVDLNAFPRLRAYYERHAGALRKRHIAAKRPGHWYGTIDKVDDSLTAREKLLFPDLKLTIHPVLDEGGF